MLRIAFVYAILLASLVDTAAFHRRELLAMRFVNNVERAPMKKYASTEINHHIQTLPVQRDGKLIKRNKVILTTALAIPLLWKLPELVKAASTRDFSLKNMGSVFSFLLAYIPCLLWGLSHSRIGSWKSLVSNWHRFGGIGTLLLPLIFALYERGTKVHVTLLPYLSCIAVIVVNVIMGAKLISRRIPAYDIPTLRAFAVGVNLALSFTGMSLFYRFGHLPSYEWIGKLFACHAIYTVIYAWSDAIQHLYNYLITKQYKEEIGKKWYLPFERPSIFHTFVKCLYLQPTKEGLDASVSPANIVTVATTFLTAIFASISLLQTRYLSSGVHGVALMRAKYPEIVRWSCYEALLAVVANNFGTFAGTLVIQNRVSQKIAGMFNALGLLIPVLHLIGLLLKGETSEIISNLISTSFRRL